jgi:hypothetical protein
MISGSKVTAARRWLPSRHEVEDRITFRARGATRRTWHRYWKHLRDQGFSVTDPVYRVFAGEVFHDGEVLVRKVDLSSRVVALQLRNVHAVDAICDGFT